VRQCTTDSSFQRAIQETFFMALIMALEEYFFRERWKDS
jgi:hypothetical protein